MKLMDVMAGTVALSLSLKKGKDSIKCIYSLLSALSVVVGYNFNEFEFSSIFIILYVAK